MLTNRRNVLGNLAVNDTNRVEIAREGAIQPLTALLQDGTLSSLKRYSVLALANLADGNDNNCRDRPCRSYSVSSHSFIRWDKGAEGRGSAVACPPFIRWRSRHGDYQQGRHSTSLNSSTSWIRGPKRSRSTHWGISLTAAKRMLRRSRVKGRFRTSLHYFELERKTKSAIVHLRWGIWRARTPSEARF